MNTVIFKPYVLGAAFTARAALDRLAAANVRADFFDVTDPATAPLFRLVNAANALAFGGLGMPPWVQLDCCTLPSVMVGFWAPAGALPADLIERLRLKAGWDVIADAQPVALSEFCAVPTLDPGAVMGVSLMSLIPGLGARSKAMGWLAVGARAHIGITQYRNPAVRAHSRLGPLEVITPGVVAHDLGEETFIYRADVPAPEVLRAWVDAPPEPAPSPPDLDPDTARLIDLRLPPAEVCAAVVDARRRWGLALILSPGHVTRDGAPHLLLARAPCARPSRSEDAHKSP
jgi:hypothetical protein